jgi:cellulose synthase/poly-beta-1,6-N-acetylglucosamine synthase-like glycosyltransferase
VIPLAALGAGLALAGLLATYVVYPLFVVAVGRRARGVPTALPHGELPFVSFLVIAYNEAEAIRSKLENTLALDWPADRFELIVASDASDDGTDEIVAAHPDPRVRLVRNPERGGKTATTALAVAAARGSVLVFSDATGVWNREAIRELVAPFADPTIGAVSGRVTYRYGESQTAQGLRFYQRWVVAQRQAEPAIGGVTSASGSIHALRREVFEPVPAHLSYDMVVPALCAMHGQRCSYVEAATSQETSRERAQEEFAARVRIAVRAYGFLGWLWSERARIRERRYPIQLFLHKVLRWFSPHLLALLLVSQALLAPGSRAAALLLVPHAGLWVLAALVAACAGRLRFPGSAPLLLFATVNAAQAVGFWRWLRGARMATWRPERGAEAGG